VEGPEIGPGNQRRQWTLAHSRTNITVEVRGGVSMLRQAICWILIAFTPASMLAANADSNAAVMYGKGTVWVNGKSAPPSSAVFAGDLIQTQAESIATLDAPGSGVIVLQNSLVKFEKNAVSLQHGGVSVATSKGMIALAREVTVTPASNAWTEFEVADADGTIQVTASKGNVNVSCGKGTAYLSEGEQTTPDDSGNCGKKRKGGAVPPMDRGAGPYILGGAIVAGGVIVCLLLCDSPKPSLSEIKP
jgi:hypothetical protein